MKNFDKAFIFIFFFFFLINLSNAQEKSIIEDDKLLYEYLKKDKFDIDTSAQAVILFHKGSYEISQTTFNTTYKVEKTIKILGNDALDLSTIMIPLISEATSRKVSATAYNLENGEIVKQNIEKNDILGEKLIDNYFKATKFNIPSVKIGTIIHYSYNIEYPNTNISLIDWYFQEEYPCIYSEFSIDFPIIIDYLPLVRSNVTMTDVKKKKELREHQGCSYASIVLDKKSYQLWIRRNIPAFKSEPFASNENNYRERVKIHIKALSRNGYYFKINADWNYLNDNYTKSNTLIGDVFQSNNFLKKEIHEITNNKATDLEKAKAIFAYVRNEITLNENLYQEYENKLRKIQNSKAANSRGINLYLTAMLKSAGLNSFPVLLSTKESERLNDYFPDPTSINHIISMVTINQKDYFLDASQKYMPFGELSPDCYNGYSRILKKEKGSSVELNPDMAINSRMTSITMEPQPNNKNKLNFVLEYYPSKQESFFFRNEMETDTEFLEKKIQRNFKKQYSTNKIDVFSDRKHFRSG